MKSVFLTILIFIGVFLFAGSDTLSVLGQNWFHYASYGIFIIVMLAGVFVTMRHKSSQANPLEVPKEKNENLRIKKKEEEHDKM